MTSAFNNSGYAGADYSPTSGRSRLDDVSFYRKVMLWVAAQFGITGLSAMMIGPLIPPAMMMPLMIGLIVVMLITAFVKFSHVGSNIFGVLVPIVIGITFYPTVVNLLSVGAIGTLLTAIIAGCVVFGVVAVFAWGSNKSINRFSGIMFAVLLGIIVISLLNAFLFHSSMMSVALSVVTLILFTFYVFMDIQRLRDRNLDMPASGYALQLYLDLVNIITSILNIMRA